MLETDNLIRGISENGGVVFYGIDSTAIVREMERLHKTSAVTTAALGRLLTGAAMMGAMLKSRSDSLTLQINGGGPAGRLLAVADGDGHVKGYVQNPVVELPPLASGEIAEDLTNYFAISEQTPTVCALGVLVNADLSVQCAGGFILQLLPGATEAEIAHLEKNIAALPQVTAMLAEGKTPEDMMQLALAGFAPEVLDSDTVTYQCDCSEDRVRRMLRSLGRKEVERLREEDPHAEVDCQFCDKVYHIDLGELLASWPAAETDDTASKEK